MEGICCPCLPSPPSLSNHQTLTRRANPLLSFHRSQKLQMHQTLHRHQTPAGARAFRSLLVATTANPPPPVDVSVLLQTGGLMLFFYWITNFVVPEMISKDFQASSEEAAQVPAAAAAEEEEEEEEKEKEKEKEEELEAEEERKEKKGSMSIKAIDRGKKSKRRVKS